MELLVGWIVGFWIVLIVLSVFVYKQTNGSPRWKMNKKSKDIVYSFVNEEAAPLGDMIEYHKQNGVVDYEID